jgi:hypothetical protein
MSVDAARLADALRATVRGEVRFDDGSRALYAIDRDKYEVSMRCAERVLLPAVRAAAPGTLVLASGYSCREQVEQATGRRPLHLAEVLAHDASRAAGDDAARRPPGEGPR